MNLLILKDNTESVELFLGGVVTTNELEWTAFYFDEASGSQTLSSSNGVSNGTTDVEVIAAPSSGQRVVKEIIVYNADTVDADVTVQFVDGANDRRIVTETLSANSAWVFTDAATAAGGSGSTSPLTTKGDLWGYSTVDARLGVGSNGTLLTADSSEALGVKWAVPTKYVWVIAGVSSNSAIEGAQKLQRVRTQDVDLVPVTWIVPADFSTLSSMYIYYIPNAGNIATFETHSFYGATGTLYNTHSSSDTTHSVLETNTQINRVDVSGLVTSLAVGDVLLLHINGTGAGNNNAFDIYGLEVIYT